MLGVSRRCVVVAVSLPNGLAFKGRRVETLVPALNNDRWKLGNRVLPRLDPQTLPLPFWASQPTVRRLNEGSGKTFGEDTPGIAECAKKS